MISEKAIIKGGLVAGALGLFYMMLKGSKDNDPKPTAPAPLNGIKKSKKRKANKKDKAAATRAAFATMGDKGKLFKKNKNGKRDKRKGKGFSGVGTVVRSN